jgi:protein CpxP
MNRTKLLTIAVLGLLVLNTGTLGMLLLRGPAHHPHGDMPPPPPGEGPKRIIIERLHFDEAQQKQYEALIDDHRKRTAELHEASRNLHKELYSLLAADTADKAKADALILQIAENQKATDHLNFDHFRQIKAVCRPEQLSDFNRLSEELSELFAPKGPPPPGR